MASLSKDEGMLTAFNNGLDIHSATAAKVYKISLEESLGENAVEKLEKDVLVHIDKLNHAAEKLYRNWMFNVFGD